MNLFIGNIIKRFIGSLTRYLRGLGKNLKDFVMSPRVASLSILESSENMFETGSFPTCTALVGCS